MLHPFIITDERLESFLRAFSDDLQKGLKKETNSEADMKCFPTYVSRLPSGKEKGRYLALDLGGTHFRVLLVDLDAARPGTEDGMTFRTFDVPDHLMVGSVYPLFDHIADCVAQFVADEGLQKDHLPLGFTFSFLCRQVSLTNAVLESWSKGFKCDDALGQNVAQLLADALARREDVDVECVAVINDTTGTLMTCAFEDSDAAVGLIFGTGSNACYIEKLSEAEMWISGENDAGRPETGILNCEWGAFGNGGCLDDAGIRTDIDKAVDAATNNKGGHLFEKLIGGKYLGEIVRLALCRLRGDGLVFKKQDSFQFDVIRGQGRFLSKYVSDIELDSVPDFPTTRRILDELGIRRITARECSIVRRVCETVSRRSAMLAGAAAASLLNQMGRKSVTVGVDGSVYRFHPTFAAIMNETMRKTLKEGIVFKMKLSRDGSGRGAALVAAAAVNR